MSDRFDKVVSVVAAVAALVVAASFAHREFFGRPTGALPVPALASASAPRFVPAWRTLAAQGRALGDTSAAIIIVEVADFECRFCRQFNLTLAAVATFYGTSVSRIFIDLPLPTHRFALPAARAAECAAKQGRFPEMHDILFSKQDSLGLKQWVSYARDAGVRETVAFERCIADTSRLTSVDNAINAARTFGVRMAPTVIVGGWMFPRPPTEATLRATIDAIRSGKEPTFNIARGNR